MGTMAHKLPPSPRSIPSVPQSTRRILWFPPPKGFYPMLHIYFQDFGSRGSTNTRVPLGASRSLQNRTLPPGPGRDN